MEGDLTRGKLIPLTFRGSGSQCLFICSTLLNVNSSIWQIEVKFLKFKQSGLNIFVSKTLPNIEEGVDNLVELPLDTVS